MEQDPTKQENGNRQSFADRLRVGLTAMGEWVKSITPEGRFNKRVEEFAKFLDGYGASHQLMASRMFLDREREEGELTQEEIQQLETKIFSYEDRMRVAGLDPESIKEITEEKKF